MFVQNNECGCNKCSCPKEIFDKPETIILQKGDKGDTGTGFIASTPEQVNEGVNNTTAITPLAMFRSGTTGNRPSGTLVVGLDYYDITIGKPIWWNGTVWKDAVGTTV